MTGLASRESMDNKTQQICELHKEVHEKVRTNIQETTSNNNEFVDLKSKVKDIQEKLHELLQSKTHECKICIKYHVHATVKVTQFNDCD